MKLKVHELQAQCPSLRICRNTARPACSQRLHTTYTTRQRLTLCVPESVAHSVSALLKKMSAEPDGGVSTSSEGREWYSE